MYEERQATFTNFGNKPTSNEGVVNTRTLSPNHFGCLEEEDGLTNTSASEIAQSNTSSNGNIYRGLFDTNDDI